MQDQASCVIWDHLGHIFILLFSCSTTLAAEEANFQPVRFVDATKALGLSIASEGACWADLNNDGWTDLCAGGLAWRNEKGKHFSRFSNNNFGRVVAADYDNDGFVDLFSISQIKLWRNLGDGRFSAISLPTLPRTVSRGACWADFNRDGFVDLYIGGYEDWDANITYPSMVLTNANGTNFGLAFLDNRFRARGITACDFDRDGCVEVYVSNYRLMPNLLWLGNSRNAWVDGATNFNAIATSSGFDGGHSIGACWGDFDNDGEFDLFAGNFAHVDKRGDQPKSRFLRNQGRTQRYHFDDRGTCGVFYQESYASPAAGDYDNDGKLDLFFTTVYAVASFKKENFPVLFHNDGNFSFSDATEHSGLALLGATYQAAWADFDQDGDLDLATSGKIFVNQGSIGHWLEVRLRGCDGINGSAIGAQVRIKTEWGILTRQVEAGTGEGNQNDLTLHFGLGSHSSPVDLEVIWPDGQRNVVTKAALDHIINFDIDQTDVSRSLKGD